jgi:hypothetical protein
MKNFEDYPELCPNEGLGRRKSRRDVLPMLLNENYYS